jgi:hypothetical protein
MNEARVFSSDVAFTPTVKAIQSRKGSRRAYSHMEEEGAWGTTLDADMAAFVEAQISVFLATVNTEGQPYIQHRGGPPGFLKVLDPKTIAFVDFAGNRQYISQGNLSDNPKAHLFLIDYVNRRRVKIWGEAKVIEGDKELIAKLMPPNYRARPEQVMILTVNAWDANCPQHIPQRFEAADVAAALAGKDEAIARLEAEVQRLKSGRTV